MPNIIDADGRETVVDEVKLKQLHRDVEADRRDMVAHTVYEGDGHISLWDYIDESWTRALPRAPMSDQKSSKVYQSYLDKVVIKCSACSYTTVFNNGIRQHVNAVREQAEGHKGATIQETAGGARMCTGCACTFHSRPGRAQRHIVQVLEMTVAHQARVEALHMRRYGLAPSEPVILHREVVDEGPDIYQMGQTEPTLPGPRNRRRRRRRKANGNGSSGTNGATALG
jgi:hypothetical protein